MNAHNYNNDIQNYLNNYQGNSQNLNFPLYGQIQNMPETASANNKEAGANENFGNIGNNDAQRKISTCTPPLAE